MPAARAIPLLFGLSRNWRTILRGRRTGVRMLVPIVLFESYIRLKLLAT